MGFSWFASPSYAVEPGFGSAETENGLDAQGFELDGVGPSGEVSPVAKDGWVTTQVVDIMEPVRAGESFRIFSGVDGRVYSIPASDRETIADAQLALKKGLPVSLLVVSGEVVAFQSPDLTDEEIEQFGIGILDHEPAPEEQYFPTQLQSLSRAEEIFSRMHRSFKRKSQCYQRAHVWTYEMAGDYGVKSMKAFLFFTNRYIREYNYDWWFHVTPFVYVNGTAYTMDRTFTKAPLTMRQWTNVFMHNDAFCPEVTHYDDYRNNQYRQYCYLRVLPMYYYQPLNIRKRDVEGVKVSSFQEWEVRHAYRVKR